MVGNAIYRLLNDPQNHFNFNEIKLLTPSREELNLEQSDEVDYWFKKNK